MAQADRPVSPHGRAASDDMVSHAARLMQVENPAKRGRRRPETQPRAIPASQGQGTTLDVRLTVQHTQ